MQNDKIFCLDMDTCLFVFEGLCFYFKLWEHVSCLFQDTPDSHFAALSL